MFTVFQISLEWIGDVAKRLQKTATFKDYDPESMKNGYTCLLPGKKTFDLMIKNTQERGIQVQHYRNSHLLIYWWY